MRNPQAWLRSFDRQHPADPVAPAAHHLCRDSFYIVRVPSLVYGMIGERYEAYTAATRRPRHQGSNQPIRTTAIWERVSTLQLASIHSRELAPPITFFRWPRQTSAMIAIFQDDEAPLLFKLRMAVKSICSKHCRIILNASAQNQKARDSERTRSKRGMRITTIRTTSRKPLRLCVRLISAKQEGRSDLLRISFRYPRSDHCRRLFEPTGKFIDRRPSRPGADSGAEVFFQQQSKRLELEAEKAAADLQNFSVAASISLCRRSARPASQAGKRSRNPISNDPRPDRRAKGPKTSNDGSAGGTKSPSPNQRLFPPSSITLGGSGVPGLSPSATWTP